MFRRTNYPPLLPPGAFGQPLSPLPYAVREQITHSLRTGRGAGTEVTRAFLAGINLNILAAAPPPDQDAVAAYLVNLSTRSLTSLAQSFTVALRQCGSPVELPMLSYTVRHGYLVFVLTIPLSDSL